MTGPHVAVYVVRLLALLAALSRARGDREFRPLVWLAALGTVGSAVVDIAHVVQGDAPMPYQGGAPLWAWRVEHAAWLAWFVSVPACADALRGVSRHRIHVGVWLALVALVCGGYPLIRGERLRLLYSVIQVAIALYVGLSVYLAKRGGVERTPARVIGFAFLAGEITLPAVVYAQIGPWNYTEAVRFVQFCFMLVGCLWVRRYRSLSDLPSRSS
ncbi:hypothetical protein KEG38_31640 [Polyangium jinanense]|uniref:hypothetical protein n=1 Tax=Polyangium jinanense TaxID=2829994 RepID=UPI00233FDB38|nr:hypothetical protein [Polyangium jinanense]MDC3958452.1 hypothetical protein [Polyangium jinanense]